MDIAQRIANLSPEKRELLIRSIQSRKGEVSSTTITARRRDGNKIPVSFAQHRLWFLYRLEPESCAYNMAGALRARGTLNIPALERTLNEIIRRHENLRTTFREVEDQPVQVIAPEATLPLKHIDLQYLPEEEREREAVRLAYAEAHTPFDLACGPLIRATLIHLGPEDFAWLWTMHHIICDGWANALLIEEIVTLYEAFILDQRSPLPDLPIQYADFALWQHEYLQGSVLEKHLGYWKQQLGNDLPSLNLPTDFPRPAFLTDRGDLKLSTVEKAQADVLRQFCQQERVTLFAVVLAAIQSLCHAYTGQEDIVIGTDVANRNRIETEGIIGFFINQLVLRTSFKSQPDFREVIRRAWNVALGAYAHQDLPFDLLVRELNPKRDPSRTPLFQVKFVLQNTPTPELKLPGLSIKPLLVDNHTSKFDILFNMQEEDGKLVLATIYNTDLFTSSTIDRFVRHLEFTFTTMVAHPDLTMDQYVVKLHDFEADYQVARQNEFREASRQRLKLNRLKGRMS